MFLVSLFVIFSTCGQVTSGISCSSKLAIVSRSSASLELTDEIFSFWTSFSTSLFSTWYSDRRSSCVSHFYRIQQNLQSSQSDEWLPEEGLKPSRTNFVSSAFFHFSILSYNLKTKSTDTFNILKNVRYTEMTHIFIIQNLPLRRHYIDTGLETSSVNFLCWYLPKRNSKWSQ